MGDRANVHIRADSQDFGVYLYTHWSGTELPETLQAALLRRERWNDDQYLARIIFDAMTEGQHGLSTGFGISARLGDGASRILTVDCGEMTVSCDGKVWSFDEYIKLTPEQLKADTWQYGQ